MNSVAVFSQLFLGSLVVLHTILLPRAYRYCANGARLSSVQPDIRYFLRPGPPHLLGCIRLPVLSPGATLSAGIVLSCSLIAALLAPGPVFARTALAGAAISSLIYFSQLRDFNFVRRKANTIPVILLLLCLSPGICPGSSDATARWPILAAGIILVQVYLSAGIEKLRHEGFGWARGRVLQWALIDHELWSADNPRRLITSPGLFASASAIALIFELTVPLALTSPPVAAGYAVLGILFHLANSRLLRIHYYFIYPAYAAVPAFLIHDNGPWFDGSYGVVIVLALTGILTVVTVTGRQWWPFDKYPMYATAPPGPIFAHRLELTDTNGTVRWWRTTVSSDLERICQLLNRSAADGDMKPVIEAALLLSGTPVSSISHARVYRREFSPAGSLIQTLIWEQSFAATSTV